MTDDWSSSSSLQVAINSGSRIRSESEIALSLSLIKNPLLNEMIIHLRDIVFYILFGKGKNNEKMQKIYEYDALNEH